MSTRPRSSVPFRLRHLETWLWTGPAGHLLGGTLDFAQAFVRYLSLRRRRRQPHRS